MSDIIDRIKGLRYVHVPQASQLFEEAIAEIERLRKREELWQWCAERTAETYGGCFRPEYAERVEAAAMEFAAGDRTAGREGRDD